MSLDGRSKPSNKSPRKGRASSAGASDDDISVIAVIKKGSNSAGIPKRARYHYIRELPLAVVKSLKKSFQKAQETRTAVSNTRESLRGPLSDGDVKKPRVIELSDQASKMELRRQFNVPEKDEDEDRLSSGSGPTGLSSVPVHKLPPGTVLIKQEPRMESADGNAGASVVRTPEADAARNNSNGSSAEATTATTTTTTGSSSSSSSGSSVSSCGSASSSGGFESRSATPSSKVKRTHRAARPSGGKKILDVVPRRNPARCSSKKNPATAGVAAATSTTSTTCPRQRQRLLATRRLERNEGITELGTSRRTRPPTTPYMNTRSVTRKLYTVGATYQAPTRQDETEWREWPVHGMHERPVFHPQVGLAAGYAGRIFWSSTDTEGLDCTYREVLEGPDEVEVVSVDPRPRCTPPTSSPTSSRFLQKPPSIKNAVQPIIEGSNASFRACMHESLHSVLAYCAQVMLPSYRRIVGKKRRHDAEARTQLDEELKDGKNTEQTAANGQPLGADSLSLTELEDSSISDETLMEMSSIYKKLLPMEDLPSSREDSPPPPNDNRDKKPNDGSSLIVRNTSEASEIAKILSEYNESLKEPGAGCLAGRSLSQGSKDGMNTSSGEPEVKQKTSSISAEDTTRSLTREPSNATTITASEGFQTPDRKNSDHHWLEELLVDTSLLYCVANGVGHRDLTQYVDSLDAKQSLQWLRPREG
ncbi:uncharacterized protein LOC124408993 isoform X2 [Diprion similis]|uniref:uncharacterized protein LOC124408993 isoform X2 n=1 Tax=Diprion similis TaxID=362088 RepID=UPI001EF8F7B9|nr:uncharacterized protein LOC124408993 isoform X2 [Diprion similis]